MRARVEFFKFLFRHYFVYLLRRIYKSEMIYVGSKYSHKCLKKTFFQSIQIIAFKHSLFSTSFGFSFLFLANNIRFPIENHVSPLNFNVKYSRDFFSSNLCQFDFLFSAKYSFEIQSLLLNPRLSGLSFSFLVYSS